MKYFDFEILGLKRKLPYVQVGENLALASFVVLSDTELIQTVAPELLKRLPVRALAIRTPVWERKFCLVWDDRRSTPLLEQFCRFVAGQGEFVVRE